MIWRNTQDRYGVVQKTLHWTIALCVLAMLVMGLWMGGIEDRVLRFQVYGFHKALGITILGLMVLRLVWKLAHWNMPHHLPTHPRHERIAAGVVHWGFYALLIAMPLSGWILTSAASSTINWFGLFVVPPIVEANQNLRSTMSQAHELLAWGIWAFIGLHVAGALKHVVIDKDNTLRRMLPFATLKSFALALAVSGLLTPAMAQAAGKPVPAWTIERTQSALTFEGTQEGGPFKGRFGAFDGTINFDAKRLPESNANIIIDLASIDSKNAERDDSAKSGDWFDIATTPTATYVIDRFEKTGKDEGAYLAIGRLMLRGIERPIDLPFTLTTSEKDGTITAHAVGKTSLKRLEFNVGGGQWADEAMVGDAFTIGIDIIATRKK